MESRIRLRECIRDVKVHPHTNTGVPSHAATRAFLQKDIVHNVSINLQPFQIHRGSLFGCYIQLILKYQEIHICQRSPPRSIPRLDDPVGRFCWSLDELI